MKKILRLREWLTIDEAASHLSLTLDEQVTKADLFRLALDGYVTLSVNLVNKAWGRLGRVMPFKDMPMYEFPLPLPQLAPGEMVMVPQGKLIEDVDTITEETRFVHFDERVVSIDGVWDLTMVGAEKLDIEHEFQSLTGGPAVDLFNIGGACLCRGDDRWVHLQERQSDRRIDLPDGRKMKGPGGFFPSQGLPNGSHLVIRMEVLAGFVNRLAEPKVQPSESRAAASKERDTLLKLVIGMAVEAYRYDPEKRSSTPADIAADLAKHGLSIDDDTVRKYLKEAVNKVLPQRVRD